MEKRPPEMVGATEKPVPLTGRTTTTRLAVKAPTGPGAEESLRGGGNAGEGLPESGERHRNRSTYRLLRLCESSFRGFSRTA